MRKKTRQRLIYYAGKFFRFLFKLLFIYPFQAIWFLLKQLYYSIKEVRQDNKVSKQANKQENNKTKPETITSSSKNPKDIPPTIPPPSIGHIAHNSSFEQLAEIKSITGELPIFENKLYSSKSLIGLIIGARGSGKSAIGMRILENIRAKTDKKIFAMGFRTDALPSWITLIHDPSQLENNAIVLIDEGGIQFSSRKAMSDANVLLSELLFISRHKDVTVLFITQNSANLEINAIRQADFLILKPSSLLQKDFERGKIKEIYELVDEDFKKYKGTIGITYLYTDSYRGFITNTLPSFWSEKASKSFSGK